MMHSNGDKKVYCGGVKGIIFLKVLYGTVPYGKSFSFHRVKITISQIINTKN